MAMVGINPMSVAYPQLNPQQPQQSPLSLYGSLLDMKRSQQDYANAQVSNQILQSQAVQNQAKAQDASIAQQEQAAVRKIDPNKYYDKDGNFDSEGYSKAVYAAAPTTGQAYVDRMNTNIKGRADADKATLDLSDSVRSDLAKTMAGVADRPPSEQQQVLEDRISTYPKAMQNSARTIYQHTQQVAGNTNVDANGVPTKPGDPNGRPAPGAAAAVFRKGADLVNPKGSPPPVGDGGPPPAPGQAGAPPPPAGIDPKKSLAFLRGTGNAPNTTIDTGDAIQPGQNTPTGFVPTGAPIKKGLAPGQQPTVVGAQEAAAAGAKAGVEADTSTVREAQRSAGDSSAIKVYTQEYRALSAAPGTQLAKNNSFFTQDLARRLGLNFDSATNATVADKLQALITGYVTTNGRSNEERGNSAAMVPGVGAGKDAVNQAMNSIDDIADYNIGRYNNLDKKGLTKGGASYGAANEDARWRIANPPKASVTPQGGPSYSRTKTVDGITYGQRSDGHWEKTGGNQ